MTKRTSTHVCSVYMKSQIGIAGLPMVNFLRHFKKIREEQLAKKAAAEEALGIEMCSVCTLLSLTLVSQSFTHCLLEVKTVVVPKKERS